MLETPEIDPYTHHKTGHNLADKILAVTAIFLSGVSVFIAVRHGQPMERLVACDTHQIRPPAVRSRKGWACQRGARTQHEDSQ